MTTDPTTPVGIVASLWQRIEPAAAEILAADEVAILRTTFLRTTQDARQVGALYVAYLNYRRAEVAEAANARWVEEVGQLRRDLEREKIDAADMAERYTNNSMVLRQEAADLREVAEDLLERLVDCVEWIDAHPVGLLDVCAVDRATIEKAQRVLGLLP